MVRDGLTGGLNFFEGRELFEGIDLSGSKNKPKKERRSYQEPKIYQPLARAASLISASINKAERNTARAVTKLASIEPTGQLEEGLQPLATLILGAVPDQKPGPGLDIAQAVFAARRGVLTAEKAALRIAELLPKELPIRAIADGRMGIINEGIDPSFTPPGPFTPEDVVRIGMESLQDAGRKIQDALRLLESSVPTNEISPILRALIDAISPENTRSTAKSGSLIGEVESYINFEEVYPSAKSGSLIGEVETETRLKIGEVIEREGGARFKDGILKNGRLTDIAPLVTAINFINSASSSLWGIQEPDETTRDLNRYKKLGDGNASKGRRFALVTTAINKYLDFKQNNYTGRLTGEEQKIDLARKLISHTGSDPINSLTDSELKGLTNSGGLARGGFIDWVLKVTLDAVNDNKSQANSIGLSSYDDLLRLFNNIQSLTDPTASRIGLSEPPLDRIAELPKI